MFTEPVHKGGICLYPLHGVSFSVLLPAHIVSELRGEALELAFGCIRSGNWTSADVRDEVLV